MKELEYNRLEMEVGSKIKNISKEELPWTVVIIQTDQGRTSFLAKSFLSYGNSQGILKFEGYAYYYEHYNGFYIKDTDGKPKKFKRTLIIPCENLKYILIKEDDDLFKELNK